MQKYYLLFSITCLLALALPQSALSHDKLEGAFNAKVVQSSLHKYQKNGKKYHRYTMRIKLTGTGKIISAVAETIKDTGFDLNLKEIVDNTRYGNFSLMQRGFRYIIVFATPANKSSARFSIGSVDSEYVQIDEENHSKYHNTSTMRKGFATGNMEVQIGN